MVISLSLKEVLNRVACSQVQVFFPHEKLQVLTDKVYTIQMQLGTMKHGHHQCTDRGQLKILSDPLPYLETLGIFKPIPFPLQEYSTGHYTPLCTYITYIHHDDIININIISSQYHHQHQCHLILMSSLISTSSHINITINITNNHIPHTYI